MRFVASKGFRDKVAASKKKGIWMGGVVPLSYELKDRKLVINAAEADTVRLIYSRYVELGSVRLLADELKATGIRGNASLSPVGEARSKGSVLARGALYRILSNRLYLGEVHHRGSPANICRSSIRSCGATRPGFLPAIGMSGSTGSRLRRPACWQACCSIRQASLAHMPHASYA